MGTNRIPEKDNRVIHKSLLGQTVGAAIHTQDKKKQSKVGSTEFGASGGMQTKMAAENINRERRRKILET